MKQHLTKLKTKEKGEKKVEKIKQINQKNSNGGITLIALVITIIVLLILAAISIATLTGENGILTKAGDAKENSKDAEEDERVKLVVATALSDNLGEGLTTATLKDAIGKEFGEDKKGNLEGNGPWTFKGERNTYKIETNGKITPENSSSGGGGQETGKTASELYDKINDPNTNGYNENAMHIGDYVDYDAGEWDETKPAPTGDNPFEFGGYTAGQSRNENATGSYVDSSGNGEPKYSGWRIWDISDDGKITLISAGCPEVYFQPTGWDKAYIAEYILTGKVNSSANAENLGLGTTYTPKDWSMYKNGHEYVEEVRAMNRSDLYEWYGKYIDSTISDSRSISFSANTENKLISVADNGMYYWLCSTSGGAYIYCVFPNNRTDNTSYEAYGVRTLVTLKSDVKFGETPTKETYDNWEYNKWSIK